VNLFDNFFHKAILLILNIEKSSFSFIPDTTYWTLYLISASGWAVFQWNPQKTL
jgi:hypothetical protein